MNATEISAYLSLLSPEKKKRFLYNFEILLNQCESAMALRGPYRFVLDSNIIMRLEGLGSGQYSEGLLAIMLFFDFYRSQSVFVSDLIITPVVFYEFFRLNNVGSLKEYWSKFQSIRELVENTLDVEVLFENLNSYEKTVFHINRIEQDARLIRRALQKIAEDEFNYRLIRPARMRLRRWFKRGGPQGMPREDGLVEVWPSSAADYLYRNIETKYFDPFYVSLFLKDHMAYKIANNPKNDSRVVEKYPEKYILREVVYLDNKSRVMGLADIALFAQCNVRNQFNRQAHGTYFPASISLTIDVNLFTAMDDLSGVGIASAKVNGGEDPESIHAKFHSAFDDKKRRMGRADSQQKKFYEAAATYCRATLPLLGIDH